MSEPEIARRCTTCGVSVRDHAMFCPQCGSPIAQVTPNLAETLPLSVPKAHDEGVITDLAKTQPLSIPKVQDDGVRGRVEKVIKVSSVVIDQASYDPSLRFLLVAAVLFLLFLVLLILSKVLG
jgi:hypothetical protein